MTETDSYILNILIFLIKKMVDVVYSMPHFLDTFTAKKIKKATIMKVIKATKKLP